jgi:hypothetical protein
MFQLAARLCVRAATNAIDDLGAAGNPSAGRLWNGVAFRWAGVDRYGPALATLPKSKFQSKFQSDIPPLIVLLILRSKRRFLPHKRRPEKINTTRANAAIAGKSNAVAQIEDAIAPPRRADI